LFRLILIVLLGLNILFAKTNVHPNALITETSPYLQRHAHNPVSWYAWSNETLALAKKQNKPIFLSIGYSTCHWCHVMEEESFEHEKTAKILNEGFISIKVDREERPDIDKHYQEVHLLLNRRPGGWPTSIFCTPQNKPFFAGTFIPPESNSTSIEGMGFKELTTLIATKVSANDADLFQNADEVEGFLKEVKHPFSCWARSKASSHQGHQFTGLFLCCWR